jgi:hypothetical protein
LNTAILLNTAANVQPSLIDRIKAFRDANPGVGLAEAVEFVKTGVLAPVSAPKPPLLQPQHRNTVKANIRKLLKAEAFNSPVVAVGRLRVLYPNHAWPSDLVHIVRVEAVMLQLKAAGISSNKM